MDGGDAVLGEDVEVDVQAQVGTIEEKERDYDDEEEEG